VIVEGFLSVSFGTSLRLCELYDLYLLKTPVTSLLQTAEQQVCKKSIRKFWLHIIHPEFFSITSFGFILLSSFMGRWSILTEAFWLLASVCGCWTTYIRILALPFVFWFHNAIGIVRNMFRTDVMGTFWIVPIHVLSLCRDSSGIVVTGL
jgi:hypothetical protein